MGNNLFAKKGNVKAIIYLDKKIYKEVSLKKDDEFKIELENGEFNVIKIHDGGIEVIDASCPDKVCVHTGLIKNSSQSIVCLPHKLNIVIKGENNSDNVDVYTN